MSPIFNPAQVQLQGMPGLLNQSSSSKLDIAAPNAQALARQAFQHLAKADDLIKSDSITLMTTDKKSGSVGIIRQNDTLRAFVSGQEKDNKGFKIADVVDFTPDADGNGVAVKAWETSKEGGTLDQEKAVDPVVLKAIIKHVKPDAHIKSASIEAPANTVNP
jgi:hypothetical protein